MALINLINLNLNKIYVRVKLVTWFVIISTEKLFLILKIKERKSQFMFTKWSVDLPMLNINPVIMNVLYYPNAAGVITSIIRDMPHNLKLSHRLFTRPKSSSPNFIFLQHCWNPTAIRTKNLMSNLFFDSVNAENITSQSKSILLWPE